MLEEEKCNCDGVTMVLQSLMHLINACHRRMLLFLLWDLLIGFQSPCLVILGDQDETSKLPQTFAAVSYDIPVFFSGASL